MDGHAEAARGPLVDLDSTLAGLKLATLQVTGMAAMAYLQGIDSEQELMARIADMVGLVYLAESALLRATRLSAGPDGETAALAARLYLLRAVDRARQAGREALGRIPRGEQALPRFLGYLSEHQADLIALRRSLAEAVYEADGYPFSGRRLKS